MWLNNLQSIKRIERFASSWGIPMHPFGAVFAEGIERDRGNGGWSIINWSTRPAIVQYNKYEGSWPYLLHELSHCVCPIKPLLTEELTDTLGFEILSVLHLGLSMCEWEQWQGDFYLDVQIGTVFAEEWRNAPPAWRHRKMIEACDQARWFGLFVKDEPTYTLERLQHGTPFVVPRAEAQTPVPGGQA